jgi:hypothetical protein
MTRPARLIQRREGFPPIIVHKVFVNSTYESALLEEEPVLERDLLTANPVALVEMQFHFQA